MLALPQRCPGSSRARRAGQVCEPVWLMVGYFLRALHFFLYGMQSHHLQHQASAKNAASMLSAVHPPGLIGEECSHRRKPAHRSS